MVWPPNRYGARCLTAGISSPSPSRLNAGESGAPAGADETLPLAGPRPSPPLPAVTASVTATAKHDGAARPPRPRTPQSPSRYSSRHLCRPRAPLRPPGPGPQRLPARSLEGTSARPPLPTKERVPRIRLFRSESSSQPLAPAEHGRRRPCSAPASRAPRRLPGASAVTASRLTPRGTGESRLASQAGSAGCFVPPRGGSEAGRPTSPPRRAGRSGSPPPRPSRRGTRHRFGACVRGWEPASPAASGPSAARRRTEAPGPVFVSFVTPRPALRRPPAQQGGRRGDALSRPSSGGSTCALGQSGGFPLWQHLPAARRPRPQSLKPNSRKQLESRHVGVCATAQDWGTAQETSPTGLRGRTRPASRVRAAATGEVLTGTGDYGLYSKPKRHESHRAAH